MKIQKGQKVWVKPSVFYKEKTEPFEATVLKVGRKYFELTEMLGTRYDLETLKQVTGNYFVNQVYINLQDIFDEDEHKKLSSDIRRAFNGYGKLNYTLEQLRKIAEIIGLE